MTAQHAAPRRPPPAWRAELIAWLRHPAASLSLWLAYWEWPVFQAHYRRQYKRADRKAFRAEMAALADAETEAHVAGMTPGADPDGPVDYWPAHYPGPQTPAPTEAAAQDARPGDPPRVSPRDVVRAGATTPRGCPLCIHLDHPYGCACGSWPANPPSMTPAAVPPGVPDAPAVTAAGTQSPVPASPPGPGTPGRRDTWVVAPPSGRHVTAAPRMPVPAQRTATRPNPVLRPLPLARVPPWLVILRDDHGSERYRMADAARWLDARDAALAARTVTA